MPRPSRLHVSGGHYHVILRGNHREPLFGTVADRTVLDRIVADVVDLCDVRLHAFCWMNNHLHALLQIADRPLGEIVQRIAQRYSRYRHRKLSTTGHLFERRHRAKLVDVDAYFLTLLRYIHLNPVKAHLVADPADFPWSSHRAFLGTVSMPWVTTDFGLSLFSNDLAQARRSYKQFIQAKAEVNEEDLAREAHSDDSRVLGTDEFLSTLPDEPGNPRSTLTLQQLAESLCQDRGVSVEVLRSPSRARALSAVRIGLTKQAIAQRVATLSEVARFLHRAPSSLTRLLERHRSKCDRA